VPATLDDLRVRLADPQLHAALDRCAVLPVDRAELTGCRDAFVADAARMNDLAALVAALRDRLGSFDRPDGDWAARFDPHDADASPLDRYFFVFVFLAAVDDVLGYHRSLGIPDEASSAILADLGRHLRVFRATFGHGGLHVQGWFRLHFTGLIYDFGRLQCNRGRFDVDEQAAASAARAGAPVKPGDFCLHVHIPESGPLLPAEVTASFVRARAFFARYFPQEPYQAAMCSSWLLDDQLALYLPADSNIVRFGRVFCLLDGGRDGDGDVRNFVFRMPDATVDELPQRTTLERAVVTHLRAGKHWRVRSGWTRLSAFDTANAAS
jgi:hypothetical protein